MAKAKKTRKAAAKGKAKRQRRDYKLFLKMCEAGKTNEQIAAAVGIKVDVKSADPFKPVRALKSLARTKGLMVDGELIKLKDGNKRKEQKSKEQKPKKAKAGDSKPKIETKAVAAA